MSRYTNTPEQNAMAQELLRGAREEIAAGRLKVHGVKIKAVTKANARDVFPPGCAEIVRRYLGAPSVVL